MKILIFLRRSASALISMIIQLAKVTREKEEQAREIRRLQNTVRAAAAKLSYVHVQKCA